MILEMINRVILIPGPIIHFFFYLKWEDQILLKSNWFFPFLYFLDFRVYASVIYLTGFFLKFYLRPIPHLMFSLNIEIYFTKERF